MAFLSSLLPAIAQGIGSLTARGVNIPTSLVGGLASDLGLKNAGAAISGVSPGSAIEEMISRSMGGSTAQLSPSQALFEDIIEQLRHDPEAASNRLSDLAKGAKAVSKARESGLKADQFMQENPDLGALFRGVDTTLGSGGEGSVLGTSPGRPAGRFSLMGPHADNPYLSLFR